VDAVIFLYLKETNLPTPLYVETTFMASGDGNGGSYLGVVEQTLLIATIFVVVEGKRDER